MIYFHRMPLSDISWCSVVPYTGDTSPQREDLKGKITQAEQRGIQRSLRRKDLTMCQKWNSWVGICGVREAPVKLCLVTPLHPCPHSASVRTPRAFPQSGKSMKLIVLTWITTEHILVVCGKQHLDTLIYALHFVVNDCDVTHWFLIVAAYFNLSWV